MSVAVIPGMIEVMTRWDPDAGSRLQQAAMQLYAHRGFEATTVAEIAAEAGLTERTFFRHFADKREVLFAGSNRLEEMMVSAVRAAPPSAQPIDAIAAGLVAAGAAFNAERREYARKRQAVIGASSELRERELIKLSSLTYALAETLRRRGVSDPAASLTAEAGMGVFRVAFDRWVAETNDKDWSVLVNQSLAELKELITSR